MLDRGRQAIAVRIGKDLSEISLDCKPASVDRHHRALLLDTRAGKRAERDIWGGKGGTAGDSEEANPSRCLLTADHPKTFDTWAERAVRDEESTDVCLAHARFIRKAEAFDGDWRGALAFPEAVDFRGSGFAAQREGSRHIDHGVSVQALGFPELDRGQISHFREPVQCRILLELSIGVGQQARDRLDYEPGRGRLRAAQAVGRVPGEKEKDGRVRPAVEIRLGHGPGGDCPAVQELVEHRVDAALCSGRDRAAIELLPYLLCLGQIVGQR
jgi:hypothetical protein